MYAYMAGLAIIDIAYLICTSIRCHYNLVKGNFEKNWMCLLLLQYHFHLDGLNCETDYNLMNVDVNILPGFSTIFGTSSDLVIASMTVNRYHLIKSMLSFLLISFSTINFPHKAVCYLLNCFAKFPKIRILEF